MIVDRILQSAASPISVTLYSGRTPVNPSPDSAAVTVYRADGTVLVGPAVAVDAGVGVFTFPLSPTHTASLDRLRASWTFASGGYTQARDTRHEVVGGFLCSVAELASIYADASDSELEDRRTTIEDMLERACGRGFVPRFYRESLRVDRRGRVRLSWGDLRSIRSAIVNGITYTTDQIAHLSTDAKSGLVWGFPTTGTQVTIAYEYGWDYPEGLQSVFLTAVQEKYGPDRVDGRVRSKSVDNVRITYGDTFSAGSTDNLPFVSPDVVAFILDNRRPLIR